MSFTAFSFSGSGRNSKLPTLEVVETFSHLNIYKSYI